MAEICKRSKPNIGLLLWFRGGCRAPEPAQGRETQTLRLLLIQPRTPLGNNAGVDTVGTEGALTGSVVVAVAALGAAVLVGVAGEVWLSGGLRLTEARAVERGIIVHYRCSCSGRWGNQGKRLRALDARVQFLEDNQFSTTTKLFGQVVVGLQGRFPNSVDFSNNSTGATGSDGQTDLADPNNEISLGYNAQLTLLTQFAPGSFLLTGLQAGNLNTTVSDPANYGLVNNNFLRLGYESDTTNGLLLSDVNYRQRVTDNFAMIVGPAGVNPVNVFRGPSRVESAGFGPISRFAQRNPIIQLGGTSAGVGFDWQANPIVSVQGVYSAAFASTASAGLFNDSYTLGFQTLVTPTRNTDIALYFLNGQSGSSGGFLQTGVGDEQVSSLNGVDLETNAFGITANWDITDDITFGGWIGWTTSRQLNFDGSVQTNNWMLSLQFPDLFAGGNYGGIFFGVPPRITESNLTANGVLSGNIPSFFETGSTAFQGGRDDTAYHLEAFYRLRLTDNITITPGLVAVFNPGHNASNDTVLIGAIRTTFSF
ncbi:MAG: iron uptake porin [Spirulinaceae cyanobacterium]